MRTARDAANHAVHWAARNALRALCACWNARRLRVRIADHSRTNYWSAARRAWRMIARPPRMVKRGANTVNARDVATGTRFGTRTFNPRFRSTFY
jgi:hypothetical protein